MNTIQQALFEELEAFDPHWQTHYDTLRQAADAAGVIDLYRAYTATGRRRELESVPDTIGTIRALQRARADDMRRYGEPDYGLENPDDENLSDVEEDNDVI